LFGDEGLDRLPVKVRMVPIRRVVRQVFKTLGYDISRADMNVKGRSRLSGVLAHARQHGLRPAVVVDVGVGYGTPELYAAFPDARHLLIEPLVEFEPVLKRVTASYPGDYILAAASDREGTTTIHVSRESLETSSISSWDGLHVAATSRQVPTVRLDTACLERGLRGPFLIKVDVQGHELAVIEGASRLLTDTDAIILEVSLFAFYEGMPQFADVIAAMRERGFVVYDIFGGYYRSLDQALGQIDLVFVRESGPLRKNHVWLDSSESRIP
jgi:FkbM family methyltransferase